MSDIKECGGSAFPTSNAPGYFNSNGMTLRDYFAAKAMQGILTNRNCGEEWPLNVDPSKDDDDTDCIQLSRVAYMVADAMLSARVK